MHKVSLALVHHANQYVISDGYAERKGISEVLGLSAHQRGLLPLLQMHLRYGVPLNLHLSGTLIETIAWHHPEVFSLVSSFWSDNASTWHWSSRSGDKGAQTT